MHVLKSLPLLPSLSLCSQLTAHSLICMYVMVAGLMDQAYEYVLLKGLCTGEAYPYKVGSRSIIIC